mmetsp:Transcript_849/g.1744  ORF Transcript_849/g.1744 Transcript_849/m.1744 type:complete len:321 (+) Transcript_849:43-1005(+)
MGEEPVKAVTACSPLLVVEKQALSFCLADKLLYYGDVCWLLKEVGWILFIPWVSIPFGVLATVFVFTSTALRCRHPMQELIPELTGSFWLGANLIWMLDDVLLSEPGEQTLWAMTPVLYDDSALYDQVQFWARIGFLVGPALYALGILVLLWRWLRRRSVGSRFALLAMLLNVHVASWSIKDAFWTLEWFWSAIVADCVTLLTLVAAAAVQSGAGLCGIDRGDVAWIFWVLSSGVWIVCELRFDEALWARYAAASLALVAAIICIFSYRQVRERSAVSSLNLEKQVLRHSGCAGCESATCRSPSMIEIMRRHLSPSLRHI